VVPVEVQPVTTASIQDVRWFGGSLEPVAVFDVASKVNGRLKKLAFGIGDTVKNGDIVAWLEDEEFNDAVTAAKADVAVAKGKSERAKIARDHALAEHLRLEKLMARGVSVSDVALQAAKAEYELKSADFSVAQAEHNQKLTLQAMAQRRLDNAEVTAQWAEQDDGTRLISTRHVAPGALMSVNQPLFTIVDIDPVIVVIYVIERDYPDLSKGQSTRLACDAFPDREFHGEVTRIAPVLRYDVRQARVEIAVPNAKHELRPGMFVRAGLTFERREDATVVPREAVTQRNGMPGVFVVNGEPTKATFVEIATGIRDGDVIEVRVPSLTGNVVTLGHHLLVDGTEVKVTAKPSLAGPTP
jgi:RND family efflux transporter MFP subunit